MKKVNYPNLNDYDLSAYEELKGDVLYMINGGVVMDPADMYAMQQADAHHDEETQKEILKKYETSETPTPTSPVTTQTTPPPTSTTPPATNTTPNTNNPTTSPTTTTEDPKQNPKPSTTSGGSTDGGTTTPTNNNTTNNNGYPSCVDPTNKTVDANINSNKSVEEAFAAYYVLSDKGYSFRLVDGSNVVHTFSSVEAAAKYVKSLEIEIPDQESNRIRAENLKNSGGTYYNNIENVNTPISDMETRHAKAVQESISHMYFDESRVKSTRVVVFRPTAGLGNSFDADRYIYKSDGVREFIVYRDKVGANCETENNKKSGCFTEPDGIYHYTTEGLNLQDDGTYNSDSYQNVLRHVTYDENIPEAIRNKINKAPADFLEHCNQKIGGKITNSPWSAGCTICRGGQAQQDEFMKYLYMGLTDLSSVEKRLISLGKDSTNYNPLKWL